MKNKKKIITLKYPVGLENGKELTEIHLSRMKAKHLKALPDNITETEGQISPKMMIPLIAALADISEFEAGEIDYDDLIKIAEYVGKSMTNSL